MTFLINKNIVGTKLVECNYLEDVMAQNGNNGGNRWISYRPEIKVLDCTIRDGGLMNDHNFEDGFVKKVYDTCVAAGIDYMELGYKSDKKIFSPSKSRIRLVRLDAEAISIPILCEQCEKPLCSE